MCLTVALRAGVGFVEAVGVGASGPGGDNWREGSLARVDVLGEDVDLWGGGPHAQRWKMKVSTPALPGIVTSWGRGNSREEVESDAIDCADANYDEHRKAWNYWGPGKNHQMIDR